jgi:hypothetical protein
MAFIVHLGNSRPFLTRSENRKELMNEFWIGVMSFCLILFSDFSNDKDFQYNIGGWFYVLLMVCTLLFNLSYLVGYLLNTIKLMVLKYAKVFIHKQRHRMPFLMRLMSIEYQNKYKPV